MECGFGRVCIRRPGIDQRLGKAGVDSPAVPRFGEPRLIVAGISTVAIGFAALALASSTPELAVSLVLIGIGQGLVSPSISGLLSRITPRSEQGTVFGTLHLRANPGENDQLLHGQCAAGASVHLRAILVRVHGFVASLVVALRFTSRLNVDANGGKPGAGAQAVPAHQTLD